MKKMYVLNRPDVPTAQRGVGMVEVLVAMLVLAIGVLGFSALQGRAVEASSEAQRRSQAMLILRGLAEQMRANSAGQSSYPALVRSYQSFTSSSAPSSTCLDLSASSGLCTSSEMADYDAFNTAQSAAQQGITVSMKDCPGVSGATVKRQCLFAVWGKTTISSTNVLPTTLSSTDCMSASGVYQSDATCVMMEAY